MRSPGPAPTTNKVLMAVVEAATLRAALETNNLGYKYFQVTGIQNQSQTIEERSSNSGPAPKSGFSFAPGGLIVRISVKMLGKADDTEASAAPPQDAYEVSQVLASNGVNAAGKPTK